MRVPGDRYPSAVGIKAEFVLFHAERPGHWPQWQHQGLLADLALCKLNVNKKPMNSLKLRANLPGSPLFLPEELEAQL